MCNNASALVLDICSILDFNFNSFCKMFKVKLKTLNSIYIILLAIGFTKVYTVLFFFKSFSVTLKCTG